MSTLTMVVFFGLLLVLGSSFASRLITSDDLQVLFTKVLKNETADSDLKSIQDVFEIYRPASSSLNMQFERNSRMDVTCLICTSAFAALHDLVLEGHTDEMLSEAVITICTSLQIVSDRICQGIVPLNIPIITYIVKTTPEASPRTFCSLLLQNAGNPNTCPHNDPRFEWTIDLPAENPIENDQIVRSNNKPLKAVLVADAHIDPLYEPNGVADCNELTCCRKGQTPRTDVYKTYILDSVFKNRIFEMNGDFIMDLTLADDIRNLANLRRNFRNSPGAGYWGDYRRCDSPPWAYDDVIETIAKHRDIDVVYYLGDSIDHHVWETTYELIDSVNLYTVDKIKKEFGENVIVVPCIGNHESQPTNQYAPSTVKGTKLNTTWLYDSLARKWDFYLSEDAKATIKKYGSFTTLIRPGLRAISVNNNYAYRYNWWLVYDPLESKRLMEWLVQELYKAEQAGEKVHILAHIPPGVHDLIYSWTREYNRVVNRFSKTIAAEFNGHTHSDEFRIFYNAAGEPSAVSWGAGSATAYSNYNSNYKIATIDPVTYKPINIVNYMYNLTEANLTPNRRPHWFQLYDMKNSFQLQDLSATSMDNLVYSMVTDNLLLLDLYAAFYSKLSDGRWPYCNNDCKIDNLCKTVVTVLWHREKCEELRNLFFTTLSNLK